MGGQVVSGFGRLAIVVGRGDASIIVKGDVFTIVVFTIVAIIIIAIIIIVI